MLGLALETALAVGLVVSVLTIEACVGILLFSRVGRENNDNRRLSPIILGED